MALPGRKPSAYVWERPHFVSVIGKCVIRKTNHAKKSPKAKQPRRNRESTQPQPDFYPDPEPAPTDRAKFFIEQPLR